MNHWLNFSLHLNLTAIPCESGMLCCNTHRGFWNKVKVEPTDDGKWSPDDDVGLPGRTLDNGPGQVSDPTILALEGRRQLWQQFAAEWKCVLASVKNRIFVQKTAIFTAQNQSLHSHLHGLLPFTINYIRL
jgi:hypothetical protein